MAQNPKERFWPQQASLDLVILETSSALETGWAKAFGLRRRIP